MIKAVIFDVDGVLVDSFDSNLAFLRNIFATAGYKKLPTKSQYKKLFHMTAENAFKSLTNNNIPEVKKLMKILDEDKTPRGKAILTSDSKKVILKLSRSYKLALVTSRSKGGVNHYLENAKLHNYFETLVHFGHYRNPKPHPEPLLLACKRLKIKPNEAVYIGDARTDIEAGIAANIPVILFPKRKLKGATAYAKTFMDIPKIITDLN